ncbi:MAG: tRNA (adenosine(37)-N6)-threonylcarbamoyltransferase complex dimerization subunit type 1 TsaB [Verrucomicrobiales bacterium]
MKILALEFSSNYRSIALAESSGSNAQIIAFRHEPFSRSSSVALIDEMVKAAIPGANPFAEIQHLAIGLGPGSYTGIRSSISIAQGFELARGATLMGMSSMTILAAQLSFQEVKGEVFLVADAQKQEAYLQSFFLEAGTWKETSELSIVPLAALQNYSPNRIYGAEASRLVAGACDVSPTAETLARICPAAGKAEKGEALQPIYMREITFVKAKPPRTFD